MIADTKAADGSQAFTERADDKIHAIFDTGLLGQSASIGAQDPHRVGFIHQQISPVFFFDGHNPRQGGPIAQHAVKAFDHDQNRGVAFFKTAQPLFEVLGVVVPKPMHLGAPHPAAVIYAGMAVGIQQDDLAGADQGRQHGEVGNIAGGKNNGPLTVEKISQFLLQCDMAGKCPVGHSGSGGAGAFFAGGIAGSVDTGGIKRKPQVVIAAGQYHRTTVDHGFGTRNDFLHNDIEKIFTALLQFFAGCSQRLEFIKDSHSHPSPIIF